MKTLVTLTLLFVSTMAMAQYPANWRHAPKNPIPMQYTTDHYLIYHGVKSLRYKVEHIDWLFNFDEEGKTTTFDTGIGINKYTYTSKGHLKSLNDGYTTARFKTNDKGYITEQRYSDGSGSRFDYNDQGLYAAKFDLKTGISVEKYTYNNDNRLVVAEFQSANGDYLGKSTYAYKDLIKYVQITETAVDGLGNSQIIKHYFSKRGELLSTDYKNDVITYDIKSNATSYFNSVNNTTTTFDITYY